MDKTNCLKTGRERAIIPLRSCCIAAPSVAVGVFLTSLLSSCSPQGTAGRHGQTGEPGPIIDLSVLTFQVNSTVFGYMSQASTGLSSGFDVVFSPDPDGCGWVASAQTEGIPRTPYMELMLFAPPASGSCRIVPERPRLDLVDYRECLAYLYVVAPEEGTDRFYKAFAVSGSVEIVDDSSQGRLSGRIDAWVPASAMAVEDCERFEVLYPDGTLEIEASCSCRYRSGQETTCEMTGGPSGCDNGSDLEHVAFEWSANWCDAVFQCSGDSTICLANPGCEEPAPFVPEDLDCRGICERSLTVCRSCAFPETNTESICDRQYGRDGCESDCLKQRAAPLTNLSLGCLTRSEVCTDWLECIGGFCK